MNRRSVLAAVLLAIAGLGTVGCEDKDAKIRALNDQVAALTGKNNELQGELQQWQGRNSDLKMQLDAKDSELNAARAQIARGGVRTGTGDTGKPPTSSKTDVPSGWTPTATGAKITIGTDILFGAGKAELTKDGAAKLKEIAAQIKKTFPNATIRVVGHTDSDPIRKTKNLWDDNLDLSCNRAMDVTRELVKMGVGASHIETIGMGDTQPEVANTNAANKAKNRRVEIIAVK